MGIFNFTTSPIAIVDSDSGIKGVLTVKTASDGSINPSQDCILAIRQVRGQRAANVQMTANLNNDAYYTLFGDKMCDWNIVCFDLPGVCEGDNIKRLSDLVGLMNDAISQGRLPTVKLTYSPSKGHIVTVSGYLVSITFAMEDRYQGTIIMEIKGYAR